MNNKILKVILLTTLSTIICLIYPNLVNAEGKKETFSSSIYNDFYIKKLHADGSGKYKKLAKITRNSDGHFVYCVQPWVDLIESEEYDIYTSNQAEILGVSSDVWKRISLISYYGYGYQDHTDERWYGITQLMIWKTVDPTGSFFFTKTPNGIKDTTYDWMISEIERLISNHYTIPNLNTDNITLNMGDTVSLNDLNNILDSFSIETDNKNIDVSISNNSLNITGIENGETAIVLKKNYDSNLLDTKPFLYNHVTAQRIISRGRPDPMIINLKVNITGAKIKIHKVDSESNGKAQGNASLVGAKYKVLNSNDEIVSILTIGNDLTATTDYLPIGKYSIQEIEASTGYHIDDTIYTIDIPSSGIFDVTVREPVIKGKIKLTKIDRITGATPQGAGTLEGARYQILDSNNSVVETLVIGADSTAISKLLPYGEYKIKEIFPSKGYYLNTEISEISIKEEKIYSLNVEEDVIQNEFHFYKLYGNENTGIVYTESDAFFKVINQDGIVVTTFKTDKDGFAKLTLPYGDYSIIQVSGLENYKLMYPISIKVNETTPTIQTNYLKNGSIDARLKLIKIDSETGLPINIAGARFKIRDKNTNKYICQTIDKVICEFETNEYGIMMSPLPLFAGNYVIEEIKAPNGYLLSNEKIQFSIKENTEIIEDITYGSIVEIIFKNRQVKGNIIIHKIGEKVKIENDNFFYQTIDLPNVSFEVRAKDDIWVGGKKCFSKNELISILVTNSNGKAELNDLPLGKYIIKEVSTDKNHLLDSKIYEIELKYQDQYTESVYETVELVNFLKKSNLEFVKTDLKTGECIKGTKIEIYTEDNQKIFEGLTDENGNIFVENLFIGKFYIIETESTTGYQLSDEKVYFEVKENNEIIKASMTNEKIIEVPDTSINESKILNAIGIILIFAGIGYLLYEKRK